MIETGGIRFTFEGTGVSGTAKGVAFALGILHPPEQAGPVGGESAGGCEEGPAQMAVLLVVLRCRS